VVDASFVAFGWFNFKGGLHDLFRDESQVNRHGKENEVLSAAHGVIPPYVDKNPAPSAAPADNKSPGGGH
jgi:hypothetical protein